MNRADQLAFRWLVAAAVLLIVGVVAFWFVAISSAFDSRLPRDQALEIGLQDAAGNGLLLIVPGVIVGAVGLRLIRRPPDGWRRVFLPVAGLYLLWSVALAVKVPFLIPSAVCATISALLANGI